MRVTVPEMAGSEPTVLEGQKEKTETNSRPPHRPFWPPHRPAMSGPKWRMGGPGKSLDKAG